MYKFISIAHNIDEDWFTSMYIYQDINTNKYFITQTYPFSSRFSGENLLGSTTYYNIDYPKELTQEDINNGKVVYWNQEWKIKLT